MRRMLWNLQQRLPGLFFRKRFDKGVHSFELRPTPQKMSGVGPDGKLVGDCFPACVASVLHIDLEEIPLFSLKSLGLQVDEANEWLEVRGLSLHLWPANHEPPKDQYYLVRGASPRYKGHYHMVVGKNGKIVHDPHPDGRGIVGGPTHYLYFRKLNS